MGWWQDILGVGGAFGLGSLAGSFLDRRHAANEAQRTRDHATKEARAARQFQARFDAYKEASTHLERIRQYVEWTEPVIGPKPRPPDIQPDDAFTSLSGVVAVTLSDEVRHAMQASSEAASAFIFAVEEFRDSRDNPAYTPWDPSDKRSAAQKMQDARSSAFAAIRKAQDVMRDELAEL
jgi:hypothetical protein